MKKSNIIDQRKDIRQKFFIVGVQAHLLFVASVVDQPKSNRGESHPTRFSYRPHGARRRAYSGHYARMYP